MDVWALILADTLSSPQLTALPKDLGEFMNVMADVARRLQPLGQLAESAGGFFGLRPLAAMRSSGRRPSDPAPPPPAPVVSTLTGDVPVKRAPAKRAPAKRAPAKKVPAKKVPAKKVPAKKAPVKKAPGKRARVT